jgi:chromosome segregation ATPase
MNSDIFPKYNCATLNTKGASAKIKSCILFSLLTLLFNSATSFGQSNVELIEQEIEKAENSLKTTEKFIEQLLWSVVPANQAETQKVKTQAAQSATQLTDLAATVNASQARLLQSRNQLERTNRILITSQQELQQAKKEIENLERQTSLSLDTLANQAANIERLEANTRTANATIEQSMPELQQRRSILETASQQSQLRDQQSQQMQQTEVEFEQTLASKQEQINSQNRELLALRKQQQVLKSKLLDEQGDWNKVAAQVATRNSKREQLEAQIIDNKRLISRTTEGLGASEDDLQKAQIATSKKRDELTSAKSKLALAKTDLKDSQQQLRRAEADLGNDQSAASREISIQNSIVSDIQENDRVTSQLKKNRADILIEIGQLEKLLEGKNQSLAPLREKTEQLRQQQQESVKRQSAERQKFDQASATLIATDRRFQQSAAELKTLEQSIGDIRGQ